MEKVQVGQTAGEKRSVEEIKNNIYDLEQLIKDQSKLETKVAAEVETEILKLKESNLNAYINYKVQMQAEAQEKELKREAAAQQKLLKLGYDTTDAEAAHKEKVEKRMQAARKAIMKNVSDPATQKRQLDALEKERKRIEKEELKSLDKKQKYALKLQKALIQEKAKEESKQDGKALREGLLGEGKSLKERGMALKEAFTGETGKLDLEKGFSALTNALSDLASGLDKQIDEIANSKAAIDTRLQGSNLNETDYSGSYWNKISNDISSKIGVSTLVKQSDIADKIKEYVGQGISYDVEQRAFLQVISDRIATTFNATDGMLLKLVRIQQQDSTAGRLGMESALNTFLNSMYETTEYLGSLSSNVRSALYEAEALMDAATATGFEYQVQKWLGSMYSVGMSDSAVNKIASSLGQIASGQIEALSGSQTGNLLIQAANGANLSISEMLKDGLNADDTNKLLGAAVDFLSKLYDQAADSKVIQQQIANVYGVSASDLKAAANLASTTEDLKSVTDSYLNYDQSIQQLQYMANTMYNRTSIGQMLGNATENFTYGLSAGIADSPVLYATYKIANLLEDTVGGINIPTITAFGNGVDLNATVADLLKVGALSGSMIKGIGNVIGSLNGMFDGSGLLDNFGVANNVTALQRGTAAGNGTFLKRGADTSSSGSVMSNNSSDDIKNKTLSDANNDANEQLVSAKEENGTTADLDTINSSVVQIYELIKAVTEGSSTLKVTVSDYGLTGSWYSNNPQQ